SQQVQGDPVQGHLLPKHRQWVRVGICEFAKLFILGIVLPEKTHPCETDQCAPHHHRWHRRIRRRHWLRESNGDRESCDRPRYSLTSRERNSASPGRLTGDIGVPLEESARMQVTLIAADASTTRSIVKGCGPRPSRATGQLGGSHACLPLG